MDPVSDWAMQQRRAEDVVHLLRGAKPSIDAALCVQAVDQGVYNLGGLLYQMTHSRPFGLRSLLEERLPFWINHDPHPSSSSVVVVDVVVDALHR